MALKAVLIFDPCFYEVSPYTEFLLLLLLHMLALEGMFIEPVAKKPRSFEASPCMDEAEELEFHLTP